MIQYWALHPMRTTCKHIYTITITRHKFYYCGNTQTRYSTPQGIFEKARTSIYYNYYTRM
jgi:hypothetical protein